MRNEHFNISVTDWASSHEALSAVRSEVFIREQSVPAALEWDGLDDEAVHLIATAANGTAIGCARLLQETYGAHGVDEGPVGHAGRVAVVKPWRHQGVGSALMHELIRQAVRAGYSQLTLAAQLHAIPFYQRLGFMAYGTEFLDAGIPHINMRTSL
jgi:predicted GNAT family N-acyltransferase